MTRARLADAALTHDLTGAQPETLYEGGPDPLQLLAPDLATKLVKRDGKRQSVLRLKQRPDRLYV